MASLLKALRTLCIRDECSKRYVLGPTIQNSGSVKIMHASGKSDQSNWTITCIKLGSLTTAHANSLRKEIELLQMIDHENIVKLKEVIECEKVIYLVFERMSGGELFDRIQENGIFSEKEARKTITMIAKGLDYCHSKGIVHRGLKLENLIYKSKQPEADLKISDFGVAKLVRDDALMMTPVGTPDYMAPEIVQGKPYTSAVDLWSLGVILYILLHGSPPFYADTTSFLFEKIKSGIYDISSESWNNISAAAKDLISKLLVVEPTHRYKALQVLEHPWISGAEFVKRNPATHQKVPTTTNIIKRRFTFAGTIVKTAAYLSKKRGYPYKISCTSDT